MIVKRIGEGYFYKPFMQIKVAIIEDQIETRQMLSILINGYENFECIASFDNSKDAVTNIPSLHPDVVLVDIHLPEGSGIDCVRALKAICPDTQFIMCTSFEDTENIFNALQAGATGYITKSTGPDKILDAINDAYNGGSPMSSQVARKVVSYFNKSEEKGNRELAKLSEREREILALLSQGYRYKEIAGELFIGIETVRKHIHNIYEKLQVTSRTEALNKTRIRNS